MDRSDLLHGQDTTINTKQDIHTDKASQLAGIGFETKLLTPRAAALHTQDRGHCDFCDRDVWRHLRLFIGHDNNKILAWTQSSSFTYPR
ncbi:hypothetical protein LAZ67_2005071 [Cordylochernes scorpioides]|uniref:Uncharacterized protein n=1 Tax=Cordylochernes scorpioides TaxID=51811 RepID=A0ABY6K8P1_9ARAC|nr:hypothetical protein LAZ67_2005071 [Cordylochernes scorpioides]